MGVSVCVCVFFLFFFEGGEVLGWIDMFWNRWVYFWVDKCLGVVCGSGLVCF